jgi:hypothetical protein
MSGVKSIFKNMIVLGVLVFAIMNFIIIMQVDSSMSDENMITNNSLINDSYGELANSLNNQDTIEGSLNSLEDVPPTEYVGDLDVGSVVSTTRNARAIVVGLWNIYIKLPQVILGVSPIVSGAITTILLLLIAIGVWAIWKGAIS